MVHLTQLDYAPDRTDRTPSAVLRLLAVLDELLDVDRNLSGLRAVVINARDLVAGFVKRLAFDLFNHEAAEAAFFGRPPITETNSSTGDIEERLDVLVADLTIRIEDDRNGQTPMWNARSGDADGRLGRTLVHDTTLHERRPRNVALLVQTIEFTEVCAEVQEVKESRGLGSRDRLLPLVGDTLAGNDKRCDDVLHRYAHVTFFAPVELGARFVLDRPISANRQTLFGPQTLKEFLGLGILEHSWRQPTECEQHQD